MIHTRSHANSFLVRGHEQGGWEVKINKKTTTKSWRNLGGRGPGPCGSKGRRETREGAKDQKKPNKIPPPDMHGACAYLVVRT